MNDYISRRAAIKAIDDLPNCYNGYSDTYDKAYIIGTLEEVPSVEPKKVVKDYFRPRNLMVVAAEDFHRFDEPKRGKWIRHVLKNANVPWGYDCSACGAWFIVGEDTIEKYDYCPNCGAKMERSEE